MNEILNISANIDNDSSKSPSKYLKCQDQEHFVVIVSRIIYVKVG